MFAFGLWVLSPEKNIDRRGSDETTIYLVQTETGGPLLMESLLVANGLPQTTDLYV